MRNQNVVTMVWLEGFNTESSGPESVVLRKRSNFLVPFFQGFFLILLMNIHIMNSPLQNSLNLFSYCPKCGSDNTLENVANSIQCARCGLVYYLNPSVAVVALLRNEKEEILFTKRKFDPQKGKYDFPGGFVDMGESLEHALERELMEELNLEIVNPIYFGSFPTVYPFKGCTYYPVDTVFECTVKDWSCLRTGDDVEAVCFRSVFKILDEELAFPSHRLIVKELQSNT